ncbi:MAG: hypothetical protein AB7E96_01670 [Deferribacterales bacterium]
MNQTDIQLNRSLNITDTETNGGRENKAGGIVSGVKFNLFPRVTSSERETGIVRYRKVFMSNMNTSGETAYGACAGLSSPGNGQDSFYIARGTHTDAQPDAESLTWTGCGQLVSDAAAGDTTIQVYFKTADYTIPDGCLLILRTGENTETVRISTASFNGNTATISLQAQLADSYLASDTYAGVMLELGDLTPGYENVSVSSLTGQFDPSAMTLYNAGTEYDTYSLTFTSALSYTVAGAETGVLPSGTISSSYSPINEKTARPYFTIPAECFSGTFEAGNSVSFDTRPASAGFWIKESVPAGCPHEPDNKTTIDWLID